MIDPVTLSVAAVAYLGAEVGRKATEEAAGKLWEQIKFTWSKVFGQTPTPKELSSDTVVKAEAESHQFGEVVHRLVSRTGSLKRLRLTGHALNGAHILWIDDRPENNAWEIAMFGALGVNIRTAETTRSALALLEGQPFDLVISDIARAWPQEGLDSLTALQHASAERIPVLFYVTDLKPSGVPAGAFGITNDPNELLHLVLDIVERSRL